MFPEPEGATPLDLNETRGLKHKHVATRSELDELEQDNRSRGGAWLRRKRKGDILTLNFLCKLHDKLFGDVWRWAGRFRLTEKNIGVAPSQVAVQLQTLCDDARFGRKTPSGLQKRPPLASTTAWCRSTLFPTATGATPASRRTSI